MSANDSQPFRPCVLIPTYNNPLTIRSVVLKAREFVSDVLVVDDGSDEPGRLACQALTAEHLAHVTHRQHNGGKGAAVKTGFEVLLKLGFTHALQIDGDGQHDLGKIPQFLDAARASPNAVLLGYPLYDTTAPKSRLIARRITTFWVTLELGSKDVIRDAMVGFRMYPLYAVCAVPVSSNRMDFDVEIAVRLARAGVQIINLPVNVQYLTEEEGGVSHFNVVRDTIRLSWLHTRLCVSGLLRWFVRPLRLTR